MLNILKSGFFTTVQDVGRFGYRNKGVPVSGAMDEIAVKELNKLLGNKATDALLEITMTGPKLEFLSATTIVMGGANFGAKLNGIPIENYHCYSIAKGDVLDYGRVKSGVRGYLAIKGGILSNQVLGSKSFYFPLTPNQCLKNGGILEYETLAKFINQQSDFNSSYLIENELVVFKGPEYSMLTDRQLGQLFGRDFTVAKENNRMAYQLEEKITSHKTSMLTSATLPGTVQLTPAGKLIILMKDGQTTGGYPRILQLSDRAISILAQKKAGDKLSFKMI